MMTHGAVKTDRHGDADSDVLKRIADGDPNAFEVVMRRYNRRLYRTARSIVKDDAEAEDVLQDAYLQAYRHLAAYRGEASLATWLTRIVVNAAIVRSRKARHRAEVIQLNGESEWDEAHTEAAMEAGPTNAPEQAAERSELRRMIEKRIDDLPEAFRVVFVLRAVEEMSAEETAACLGIPDATVRTRYFRARSLLRLSLARDLDFALEDAFAFDGARCDRIVAGVLSHLAGPPLPRA